MKGFLKNEKGVGMIPSNQLTIWELLIAIQRVLYMLKELDKDSLTTIS